MFEMVVMMIVLASIVAKLENKVMLAKAVKPAVILEALPCPLYSTALSSTARKGGRRR